MPPDLGKWLDDPELQRIETWKPFDNVHFVGVCWVSAWLIETSEGAVLIDTLYGPHVDTLIENIRATGVDFADIRYVLMTHGHFVIMAAGCADEGAFAQRDLCDVATRLG